MQNPLRLDGSVALVTGAASGIGRAICLRFAQEGAAIAAADLNQAGAEETARAVGSGARAYKLNVAATDECRALADRVARDFGRIDILVNCAGIVHVRKMFAMTEQDWDA